MQNGGSINAAVYTAPDYNQPAAYEAAHAAAIALHEYAEVADVRPTFTVAGGSAINRDADGYVVDESINRNLNAPIEYAVPVDFGRADGDGVYVDDGFYAEGGGGGGGGCNTRTVLAGSMNSSTIFSIPMEEPGAAQPSDGYSAPLAHYAVVPGSTA